MKDQQTTTHITFDEIDPHIQRVQRSQTAADHGANDGYFSRLPRMSRRATSLDSRFTTSTAGSGNEVSRLEVLRTVSLPARHTEHVQGKKRGRSSSSASARSEKGKDFQYYGRHANSWLFNDWSVKNSVRKGFNKVFSRRESEDDGAE